MVRSSVKRRRDPATATHAGPVGATIAALALTLAVAQAFAETSTPAAAKAPVRVTSSSVPRKPAVKRERKPATKPAPSTTSALSDSSATESKPGPGQDDLTLKGTQEGTAFKSLTVEGEDRVHVDFDRPELELDLDPLQAPGLAGGSSRDVLDRTTPDLAAPLLRSSATETSPYLARPYLHVFASGPVARFSPEVRDVERWTLVIANAKGQPVQTFRGKGEPPKEITWDGRSQSGAPVTPGLTYSYVLEAYDRAGNKRNFVGRGFTVSAYRLEGPTGPTLLWAARDDDSSPGSGSVAGRTDGSVPSPLLMEAASWINQSDRPTQPLTIKATARTQDQAARLAQQTARTLAPLLAGDPARLRPVSVVEPDAPEGGTVAIGPSP